jgi:hypothetical protein
MRGNLGFGVQFLVFCAAILSAGSVTFYLKTPHPKTDGV